MTKINKINQQMLHDFKAEISDMNALDMYQFISSGTAVYPGQGGPIGLLYCGLKLNGEAGELAEHIGKAMRDDNFAREPTHPFDEDFDKLTPERRALIIKEVGDTMWYLAAICRELGIKFSEAAVTNLDKLSDRDERGVLQGSGDER